MTPSSTRREFLQTAALAGLGFWVAKGATGRTYGANDKLNIASFGVGGRGGGDLDAVKGENIVALCDVNRSTLAGQAKNFPKAQTFTDFRQVFDKVKGLDAVVIGTPDHVHAPIAAMALVRGLHVYCEKPLTHTPYEARLLKALAAQAGVATQMGNQGHASPVLRESVEVMQSGVLGDVSEVHVWTDRPVGWWPQGCHRPTDTPPVPADLDWESFLGPAPWRPYNKVYQPFVWRGWWDYGTGALGDMGCHMMDQAFWGLGLGDPTVVSAETDGTGTAESPPLHSRIHYTFPRPYGELTLTWHDGKQYPSADLFQGQAIPDNGSLVVGSRGTLLLIGNGGGWKLLPEKDFKGYQPPKPWIPRSPDHHQEWIHAAKTGTKSLDDFSYAAHLAEVVLLGNVPLRTGVPLEWDAQAMRARSAVAAQQYIEKDYRRGWDIHELAGVAPYFWMKPARPVGRRHKDG